MNDQDIGISISTPIAVEFRRDGRQRAVRGQVVNILRGSIWLGVTAEPESAVLLEADDRVQLVVLRGQSVMAADATFEAHLVSSPTRLVLAVERPGEWWPIQRRSALRLQVEGPARLRMMGPAATADPAGRVEARIVNLSAGGVMLTTELPVAVGDPVEVEIGCGRGGPIRTEARVIRLDPAGRASATLRNVVLAFASIGAADQDRIVRHLFELQRQELLRRRTRVA